MTIVAMGLPLVLFMRPCVSQATAHGELLYQQVPTWCLKWNYRWPGLLAEIVHYKPDVMSLQEVDHFDELASRLEPLG